MQSIKNLLSRVQKFSPEKAIGESIEETKDQIVNLNKDQLLSGFSAKDIKIGEYYGGIFGYKNAGYAFEKYSRNPAPGLGNPDLYNTGDFFSGFTISVRMRKGSIYSSDSKNNKLVQNYPDIFGLGPTRQRTYIKEFLLAAFIYRRKQQIGL